MTPPQETPADTGSEAVYKSPPNEVEEKAATDAAQLPSAPTTDPAESDHAHKRQKQESES